MRHVMIMAGGSGTRLWPMSRARMPKQLIPFINGQSLLEISRDRALELVEEDRLYICAGQGHREMIQRALPGFDAGRYLGEPEGRDTLAAVAFGAAVIRRRDPEAVIAVLTSDHLIEPVETFAAVVKEGFELAERAEPTLVTFGIAPTHPATGFGYLELGRPREGKARVVDQFKEKPDAVTARQYVEAGPQKYLWNSGMFVWKASTLLGCVERYEPEVYRDITAIAEAWDTPERDAKLAEIYPRIKKISVDYAVMEPASRDDKVEVVGLPMELTWLDVGSWPAFAATCPTDDRLNAHGGGKRVLLDCRGTLAASSDPNHLIAAIGCENLIIIHTPEATLVCPASRAEQIKKLHEMVGQEQGQELL
ncbi:MAG: mannose-1-phosphate guanylyltransferase [Phycisphaeraceae bacterium]|nr:mannose-1-phosphate guanylyltransferase [Phycisphaeraceae bacterium]